MIEMCLSQAASMLQADYRGPDVRFRGCTIDSRRVDGGELFFALRGTVSDGHDHVEDAARRGAAAAMVEHDPGPTRLPLLQVDQVREGLSRLAGCWRSGFDVSLVAVTGSNGKSTVKEMLSRVLGTRAPVLATQGNLNNELGVPLTLFRLDREHRYAVVEMGANHPGDIRSLCAWAKPAVAVITQCAPAHLEGFGDLDTVAAAKAEIFEALPAEGMAVINADDAYAAFWRSVARDCRVLSFGVVSEADVRGQELKTCPPAGVNHFLLRLPGQELPVRLPLSGRHNLMNALAAAACAYGLGTEAEHIRQGLESVPPLQGRLQPRTGVCGSLILDDSYNANPGSLQAALEVLEAYPGRRWLVLGDMYELGEQAEECHRDAGRAARDYAVERLFAVGPLAAQAAQSFGTGGSTYADLQELIGALLAQLRPGTTLLIKGSRGMNMEQVVQPLLERAGC